MIYFLNNLTKYIFFLRFENILTEAYTKSCFTLTCFLLDTILQQPFDWGKIKKHKDVCMEQSWNSVLDLLIF